jgi:hypothetical protein
MLLYGGVIMNYMGESFSCGGYNTRERIQNFYIPCNIYNVTILGIPFNQSINYEVIKIKQIITVEEIIETKEIIKNYSTCYIDRGGDGGFSRIKNDQDTTEKSLRYDFMKISSYEQFIKQRKKHKRDKFILKMLDDIDLLSNIYYNHMNAYQYIMEHDLHVKDLIGYEKN